MQNFRTYNLAVEFHSLCAVLPVVGDAKNQLHRASRSIVLNLAEGRGRFGLKDQRKFFHIAFGSLRECQAVLTLEGFGNTDCFKKADILAAHLFKLIKYMK